MAGTVILICVMTLVVVIGRYALHEGRKVEIRNQRKKRK